jgi:hypothetical protein
MNLKKYCKNKIKKFKYFCIKKKCAFALLISDKLIIYMNRLKEEASKYPASYQSINKIDPKARKWVKFNPWFGEDTFLTNGAFKIHDELINQEGIRGTTKKYYNELDKRMYSIYKDELKKYFSMGN